MAERQDAAALIDEEPGARIPLTTFSVGERPKATLQQAARDGREDVVRQWLNRLPKYHKTEVLDAKDSEGYTAMHYATKFNRFKIMQLLVTCGASADIKTSDDELTPLHFSSRYIPRYQDDSSEQRETANESVAEVTILSSSKRAVLFLVQYCRVDVNVKAQYGISPLHLACQRGNRDAVEILLSSSNVDVNITDDNLDTPLHEACLNGDEQIVEMLLQKMKQGDIDLLLPNDEKQTPLHVACSEGNTAIVKMILQYGFGQRKELVSAQDNEFNTPLHLACESGSEEIVRILLLNGADIHAEKDEEVSPLHIAARYGFIEVAKTLLDSGLDIKDILDASQRTPLHFAAQFNQCDMVGFLLDKGANIDALDSNSNSPLLTAAVHGETDVFRTLLSRGAPIDVVDKNGRSAVFVAAEYNHVPILKMLVSNTTGLKLCRTVDSSHNTPLHIAAAKGNLAAAKSLLFAGVKIDARNELNKTPMHLACQNGHVAIVRELIRNKRGTIVDEDEDGNTPLHQACLNGHISVAKVLVDADAEVEARNAVLWTPMDCAAARGHDQLVILLINADADVDPTDKSKVTPLHLACREGHLKVVETLLTYKADITNVDLNGFNALDLAIENGHEDVAMTVVKSPQWMRALRNVTEAAWGGVTTPLRKLIRKMPEVAEEVFNRCTSTNATKDGQILPDSPEYRVTFNYEFLEDFQDPASRTTQIARAITRRYTTRETAASDASSQQTEEGTESVAGKRKNKQSDAEIGTLGRFGQPLLMGSMRKGFSTDWGPVGFTKSKHPLSIMVESQRIDLLKHPLVTSLLNYKWRTYGRYVYFGNLLIYFIFLIFLTSFALLVTNPLTETCQAVFDGTFGSSNSTLCNPSASTAGQTGSGSGAGAPVMRPGPILCGSCEMDVNLNTLRFLYVAAAIIILFSFIRLCAEGFQFFQLRLRYLLDWVNWIECLLFSLSIIFAWVFHTECLCPLRWQWQIGATAVFLAWIDLIIIFRKLPLTGIFVVMFLDIFYTFLKMIILSFLLVIAFSLAFYMAFFVPGAQFERSSFATPARSLIKTMTMTTGEFEFDGIFRQIPGGTEEGVLPTELEFVPISFIIWIIFLILMPILLMNLLVGLAVDDIKGIQEAAVLKRLALQVELALSAEEFFPRRVRRYFIIGHRQVKPNRPLTLWEHFRYSVWGGARFDSAESITNALHPPLEPIEQVQLQTRSLIGDVGKMRQSLEELADRNQTLEALLKEIAKKQGITIETTSGGELSFL